MRCSGWSSLAISVCSALVLAAPAAAHIVATPTFLASGSSESITFAGPNERDARMTAFSITAPPGTSIEHAHEAAGWNEELNDTGSKATWTGGSLGLNDEIEFGVTLTAETEPGFVELLARQRYKDGGVVRWSVPLTITPATDSPGQNLAIAGIVGLIGVLVVVAVGMVAWRRRA